MTSLEGITVDPATPEELENFVAQNKRWLLDEAEKILRGMSPLDQKRVISAGTMSSVREPVAVIQARVRKAREVETQIGRGQGAGSAIVGGSSAAIVGTGARVGMSDLVLPKPATKEEVEAFLKLNERWMQGEAVDLLRSMNPVDQKRVMSGGTLSGCRDPVAVIQTRAKKAREMELELANLEAGKRVDTPTVAAPQFSTVTASMHLYAPPEVVDQEDSRFAPPPIPTIAHHDDGALTAVNDSGVGAIVEILKAKYGCAKGQRLRCIGETGTLLQFEGGKTAPKDHEGKGWKWVPVPKKTEPKPAPKPVVPAAAPVSSNAPPFFKTDKKPVPASPPPEKEKERISTERHKEKEKDKGKDRKDRGKEKGKEKEKERERSRERSRGRGKERAKEKEKEKEKREKDRSRKAKAVSASSDSGSSDVKAKKERSKKSGSKRERDRESDPPSRKRDKNGKKEEAKHSKRRHPSSSPSTDRDRSIEHKAPVAHR
mmetsp:Transcript_19259/g.41488  ORF Transcript_19259/g.41488 Transcript_19259/m.41488 type:complete len:487 (-) Transcript_19259:17-1477(-)